MRKLCLTFFIAAPAFCCQPEAQFMGKAILVEACKYKINFTYFRESIVCPLSQSSAQEFVFEDSQCSTQDNQALSGVLVQLPNDKIVID